MIEEEIVVETDTTDATGPGSSATADTPANRETEEASMVAGAESAEVELPQTEESSNPA